MLAKCEWRSEKRVQILPRFPLFVLLFFFPGEFKYVSGVINNGDHARKGKRKKRKRDQAVAQSKPEKS